MYSYTNTPYTPYIYFIQGCLHYTLSLLFTAVHYNIAVHLIFILYRGVYIKILVYCSTLQICSTSYIYSIQGCLHYTPSLLQYILYLLIILYRGVHIIILLYYLLQYITNIAVHLIFILYRSVYIKILAYCSTLQILQYPLYLFYTGYNKYKMYRNICNVLQ